MFFRVICIRSLRNIHVLSKQQFFPLICLLLGLCRFVRFILSPFVMLLQFPKKTCYGSSKMTLCVCAEQLGKSSTWSIPVGDDPWQEHSRELLLVKAIISKMNLLSRNRWWLKNYNRCIAGKKIKLKNHMPNAELVTSINQFYKQWLPLA